MKVLLTATVQSHICQFHKPLVEMLHQHGCEVHVAARNNLAEKNGLKLDFVDRVYDLPFSRSPKSTDNIKAYKALKEILSREHYDVIHCNTPMGGVVTRLAARKSRKQGTKVFYTAHGFHFYKGAPKKNWRIFYPIEKWMARFCDVLLTINREDYKLASQKFHTQVEYIHGVGVDGTRYSPVCDEKKLQLRQEMGYSAEQKLLLCVGELLPNKNQMMAIRAVEQLRAKYPEILLLIAGNGSEKQNLEQYIGEHNLTDYVHLLGYCTNLEQYQHIADIAVSCSKREGLPLNVVEAMLSGTPVVATDNRGHRELIKDGENGYIVPFNDAEKMAQMIAVLFSDEVLYAQLSEKAFLYAKQYEAVSVSQELNAIYFPEKM